MVLPEEDDANIASILRKPSTMDPGKEMILKIVLPAEEDDSSDTDGASILPKTSAKDAEKEMRTKLLLVEDQNVRNARSVVIIAGIFCACCVGVAVNIFAHQNEQDSFVLEVRKSGRRRNHPCLLALQKRHH
jgi:hypothetical protein